MEQPPLKDAFQLLMGSRAPGKPKPTAAAAAAGRPGSAAPAPPPRSSGPASSLQQAPSRGATAARRVARQAPTLAAQSACVGAQPAAGPPAAPQRPLLPRPGHAAATHPSSHGVATLIHLDSTAHERPACIGRRARERSQAHRLSRSGPGRMAPLSEAAFGKGHQCRSRQCRAAGQQLLPRRDDALPGSRPAPQRGQRPCIVPTSPSNPKPPAAAAAGQAAAPTPAGWLGGCTSHWQHARTLEQPTPAATLRPAPTARAAGDCTAYLFKARAAEQRHA
jgi:hypothetical protein